MSVAEVKAFAENKGAEPFWRGQGLESEHMMLRKVERHGDAWLQLWNRDTSNQVFQLKTGGGIHEDVVTYACGLCEDYAKGKKSKQEIEIEKAEYVKEWKKQRG